MLNEGQQLAVDAAIEWNLNGSACLTGAGGTGKTFTIARIVEALKINPERIAAIAPSHSAVGSLKASLTNAGIVGCLFATAHSALGLRPIQAKWNSDKREDYAKAQQGLKEAEEEGDSEKILFFEARIRGLEREREAVKKRELIFGAGNPKVTRDGFDLMLVDECGMVNREIHDLLIDLEIPAIFLGDDLQLPPVKEEISRSFDHYNLGELTKNERSGNTDLSQIIQDVRQCNKFGVSSGLLAGLPNWSGEKEGAFIIEKDQMAKLIRGWTKENQEFRLLSYTNRSVNSLNTFAFRIVNQRQRWGMGDAVTCNLNLTRILRRENTLTFRNDGSGMGNQDDLHRIFGRKDVIWNYPVVRTGVEGVVYGISEPYDYSILDLETGPETVELVKAEVSFNDSPILEGLKAAGITHLSQKVGNGTFDSKFTEHILSCNLIQPSDIKRYSEILSQWEKIYKCFYGSKKNSKPSNGEGAEMLFELLEIDGWASVPGTPGRSRFKCDRLEEKASEGSIAFIAKNSEITPYDFETLRKACAKLYFGYRDLCDPIRPIFASTIHKSQGKSIPNVLINLRDIRRCFSNHSQLTGQKCLYTAVSRTRKLLLVLT